MFTKNLKDQFSADLLKAVEEVLEEGKGCKDCGCKKCECEDDEDEKEEKDEMKESQQIDELSKDTVKNYADRAFDQSNNILKMRHKDLPKSATKAAEQAKERRRKGIVAAGKRLGKDTMMDIASKSAKRVNEEVEQIDEIGNTPAGKRALGRYIKDRRGTILGTGMGMERQNHDRSTTDKQRKDLGRKASNAFIGVGRAVDRLTKEEVEQIDELSKDTVKSYWKKASGSLQNALGRKSDIDSIDNEIKTTGRYAGATRNGNDPTKSPFSDKTKKDINKTVGKRLSGMSIAHKKLTKEEQEFIDSLNADSLEEGRGRPPKEGSAAWHAKQKQENDDMIALGAQLRKAKSMNKKVRFMNGKEHEIHPNHIDRFEDHMAARKTSQDKAAFQKQAHKSHEDFVKAVTAPVPKAHKDTGEIVKYRH